MTQSKSINSALEHIRLAVAQQQVPDLSCLKALAQRLSRDHQRDLSRLLAAQKECLRQAEASATRLYQRHQSQERANEPVGLSVNDYPQTLDAASNASAFLNESASTVN